MTVPSHCSPKIIATLRTRIAFVSVSIFDIFLVRLTDDSGYFWFFDPTNVEVVFKVLNACGLNQAYWFYAGGLTNVQVTITVTDTKTGAVKTYTNSQGKAFQPVQDSSAFTTCP